MSTAYERAVESLRLVSREMEVADIPATDLVMATAAVNAMRDEIARLREIEAAARAVLMLALDHDDFVLIHRTDWSDFRAALTGGSE